MLSCIVMLYGNYTLSAIIDKSIAVKKVLEQGLNSIEGAGYAVFANTEKAIRMFANLAKLED